jgi:hypothetical protein
MSNEAEAGRPIRADIAVCQFTGYHIGGLRPRAPRCAISRGVKPLPMDRNRHQIEGPA